MSKPGYVDLQETLLRGARGSIVTLKVGGKFCWINPELEFGTTQAAAERFVKNYGAGPFVCNKIRRVPAGFTILTFVDEHGQTQEITSDYFTTYEAGMEKDMVIKKLSKIHKEGSTDPEVLCNATAIEFDSSHPDFAQYPALQHVLRLTCQMDESPWAK